jgi:hypothetical protein
VSGATRIVQRVICEGTGDTKSCSARGSNYLRTYKAEVEVADNQPPAAAIVPDTPLAGGEWVSGTQPLDYQASDNAGVRGAQAIVSGRTGGTDQRPCLLATPTGAFANGVPCPNGGGRIQVDTKSLLEGTQSLVVRAQDSAGNLGDSGDVTVRIDNTPPDRVDATVDGGEAWRSQNNFTISWANPPEGDRAPIAAANYKLCATSGGSCSQGEQDGSGISHLAIQVPGPGEWSLSMWRRDAAGNQDEAASSVPVTLRYEPEPPQVAFEQPSAGDPTLVSAVVTDKVSGLADGSIEISREGSNAWQGLATQTNGNHLTARVDDASLPAGTYLLRATAYDQARNPGTTTRTRSLGPGAASRWPIHAPGLVPPTHGRAEHRRAHSPHASKRHNVAGCMARIDGLAAAPGARGRPSAAVRDVRRHHPRSPCHHPARTNRATLDGGRRVHGTRSRSRRPDRLHRTNAHRPRWPMKLALALWLNAFARINDRHQLELEAFDEPPLGDGSDWQVSGRKIAGRDAVALNEASTSNGMGSWPHW